MFTNMLLRWDLFGCHCQRGSPPWLFTGVVLGQAWAELLAHSACVHRRQGRDIGTHINLKYHHCLPEEGAFSQDLGFRWDTAVFPKGWCAILGQVKGTEQCVAQRSPHLPWWLILQVAPGANRVSPQGSHAGAKGKTCGRAMGSALAALGKAGSDGERTARLLCQGAESLLKMLTGFSLFYFYKQMTELSPKGDDCSPAADCRTELQPLLGWRLCGFASHLKCLPILKACIVVV